MEKGRENKRERKALRPPGRERVVDQQRKTDKEHRRYKDMDRKKTRIRET